jgi:hypothetical protein
LALSPSHRAHRLSSAGRSIISSTSNGHPAPVSTSLCPRCTGVTSGCSKEKKKVHIGRNGQQAWCIDGPIEDLPELQLFLFARGDVIAQLFGGRGGVCVVKQVMCGELHEETPELLLVDKGRSR